MAVSLLDQQWCQRTSYADACKWIKVLDAAKRFRQRIPESQFQAVRYEPLLQNPMETILEIALFIGYEFDQQSVEAICRDIRRDNIAR